MTAQRGYSLQKLFERIKNERLGADKEGSCGSLIRSYVMRTATQGGHQRHYHEYELCLSLDSALRDLMTTNLNFNTRTSPFPHGNITSKCNVKSC